MNTFGDYGPAGFTLMGSDSPEGPAADVHSSISVSLSGDDEEELRGYWDKLAEGATITLPLDKQVLGDTFGMCTDRFGTAWLVNITQPAD